jgi:hypothetical protein
MALQMQRNFPKYGFTAPSAYHRVGSLSLSSSNSVRTLNIELRVYFNANARTNGNAPIHTEKYLLPYPTTSTAQNQYNLVKHVYEHLKSLSEFSGATDV